jgi:hypothetical protein
LIIAIGLDIFWFLTLIRGYFILLLCRVDPSKKKHTVFKTTIIVNLAIRLKFQ